MDSAEVIGAAAVTTAVAATGTVAAGITAVAVMPVALTQDADLPTPVAADMRAAEQLGEDPLAAVTGEDIAVGSHAVEAVAPMAAVDSTAVAAPTEVVAMVVGIAN
jgi:hypothetical protein